MRYHHMKKLDKINTELGHLHLYPTTLNLYSYIAFDS